MNSSSNSEVEAFADNGYYLYAALPGNGLYKTSNYGTTWSSSQIRIYARTANCLATKDSLVFIANDSGLCKSTNFGNNWELINIGTNCLYASAVIIANNYLYIGTHNGIKRSADWGNNWTLINNEIPWHYGNVRYFAYSNNTIYVAMDSIVYHLRIYKSTNYGDNWTLINQDIPSWNIAYSIYADDNLVFCGTALGIYKSTNYGTNWNLIPEINSNIGLFGFASVGTKNIFISAWNYGVYVSNDYGQTFTQKNEGLLNYRSTALYKFGDYLFLGTNPNYIPCEIYRRPLSEVVAVKNTSSEIPDSYKLSQNYPNPFNPSTIVKFSIPLCHSCGSRNPVRLIVYDILGKEVATLVNEKLQAGTYEVNFDGNNLSTGIYFYSLEVDGKRIDTKKLMLMK